MNTATAIPTATRPRVPVTERAHQLWIAGRNWTPYCREIRFQNTGTEGAATLTFESRRPMDGYEDAVVELWLAKSRVGQLGSDDFQLYFAGNLTRPMPDSPWPGATAQALGPFATMATQELGEDMIYNGQTLAHALYDVSRRAYTISGMVEVIGGDDIIIEKGEYAQEVKLMEAAKGLCTPVAYRMSDMRGLKRMFFPEPQPGSTGKSRAYFGPEHYAPGDLKVSETFATTYKEVIVFRRSEWGVYEVYERAPVEPGRVRRPAGTLYTKRIYYIGDFPGTSEQAKDTAHKMAQRLRTNEYDLQSLTVPYDPDLYRYDQITTARERERVDGVWRETFDFITAGGCSIDLSDDSQTFQGFGLMSDEEWIRPVKITVARVSPSVLIAPYQARGNPADSILVGDLVTQKYGYGRPVNDTLAVSDVVNAQKNGQQIQRTVPDTVSVADTPVPTHIQPPRRTITDSITVGDNANRVISGGATVEFSILTGTDDASFGYSSTIYPPTTANTAIGGNITTYTQAHRTLTGAAYETRSGLIRFDTSSIPDGATIISAVLEIIQSDTTTNTNGLSLRAEWYDWSGTYGNPSDHSHLVAADAIADTPLTTFTTIGAKHTFTLLNPSNVDKTGYTGLRFGLSQRAADAAPTGVNRFRFASVESGLYVEPLLRVNYT